MSAPKGYSTLQIALHWLVALVVVHQFVLHKGIETAWDAVKTGQVAPFSVLTALHVAGGILVLAFVLARIAMRLKRGAPELPAEEPAILRLAAHATHWTLYLVLIGLAASGMAAWFGGVKQAASAHGFFKNLLMLLVALHVAGALFQHFWLKSDVLRRMMRPG